MQKNKFILNNRNEVETFENMLREYIKTRAQYSLSHISLVKAYDKLRTRDDGGKIFAALIDIEINFVLLYCDIHNIGGIWNQKFSKGKLEGGSVLDSKDKFFGKMDIHRFSSSYVLLYRALRDKIMGLLILIFSPERYESFYRSKSKKKSFKRIVEKIPQISPEFITSINDSLTKFDNEFRTPESHGTGSLRKWSFLMESMAENPSIELISFWNMINDMMVKISKLFEK